MSNWTSIPELHNRPLPDFQRWLDDHGHTRSADFEAFADLMQRTQEQSAKGFGLEAECFLSLWQGLSMATVELCNMQRQRGMPPEIIVALMPRALACAAFYSVASILKDDTPWRRIAKILVEEFSFAANEAADQQHKQRTSEQQQPTP